MKTGTKAVAACWAALCLASCDGGDRRPPPPAAIQRVSVDRQVAAPGAAVPIAPAVRVVAADGGPVEGTPVRFEISAGAGSVEAATVTTDADGVASPGRWTLGSARGQNVLSATVDGLPPVVFTALAAALSGDIAVTIVAPGNDAVVGESLPVRVNVSSTFELESVVAAAGAAAAAPLTRDVPAIPEQLLPGWSGTLSVASEPSGAVPVVVSATDVFGNVTEAFVVVNLDRAPALAIVSPRERGVAQPNMALEVTCTDREGSCGAVRVIASSPSLPSLVVEGPAPLTRTVDLSAFDGHEVQLTAQAADSAGNQVSVTRTLFVEASPKLVLRAEVDGTALDASGTRLLSLEAITSPGDDGTGTVSGTLRMAEASSGATTARFTVPRAGSSIQLLDVDVSGSSGVLTPAGALLSVPYFLRSHGTSTFALFRLVEWTGDAMVDLGEVDDLSLAGSFAAFAGFRRPVEGDFPVTLRDLSTHASTTRFVAAVSGVGVAANGDLVYSDGTNVIRVRAGDATPVTSVPAGTCALRPLTDGARVLYRRATPCDGQAALVLEGAGVETVLVAPGVAIREYQLRDGWAVYTAAASGQPFQAWRADSFGKEQVTSFGSDVAIEAVGDDGAFVLSRAGRRYLARRGSALVELGSTLGTPIFRDGKVLVLLGPSVLEAQP